MSQGNSAMQHVFPTSNDSVIHFTFRTVKVVTAPTFNY